MFGMRSSPSRPRRKGDLLAADLLCPRAAQVAMRGDRCLHAGAGGVRIAPDEDRAAGVVARDLRDHPGGILHHLRALAIDGEIDQRSARRRPFTLLPEPFQLAVNAADLDGHSQTEVGDRVRHGDRGCAAGNSKFEIRNPKSLTGISKDRPKAAKSFEFRISNFEFSQSPPGPPILLDQLVRFLRSP